MKASIRYLIGSVAIGLFCASAALSPAQEEKAAEEKTEEKTEEKDPTLPPSTNPTQLVIFPSEDQTEEQQMADQLACYRWASDQTEWDPYVAYDDLVAEGHAAEQTYEEATGGLISGAARGAAAGAIIGAIAGDAGKGAAIGATAGGLGGGMRSRRQRAAAQSAAEKAIGEFNAELEKWQRNYAACMEGKDYTIK